MPLIFFGLLYFSTLLLYSVQRLVFVFYNWKLFSNQPVIDLFKALLVGLRFDLYTVSILALPAFLVSLLSFKKQQRQLSMMGVLFFSFQFPFLALNFSDAEFIHFLGRRMTYHSISLLTEVKGGANLFETLFYTWKLFVGSLLIYATYCFFLWRGWKNLRTFSVDFFSSKLAKAALFVLILISARGGLQSKPLNFAHAQVFLSPPLNLALTNTGFSILQTVKRVPLERNHFFESSEQFLPYLNGAVKNNSLIESQRLAKPQNVVLIILESFNFDYMKAAGNKGNHTPFLDELASQGLFFKNAYANSRRSIEGIASILAGIPSLMTESFINSQYVSNFFWGVGTILAERQYSSAFFHGAKNGSMYFDQFALKAGIQSYYGLNEYPNKSDYDGSWGVWDEPFLNWTAQKINSMSQPFFASVFTLTSHHPFKIPDPYKGVFPKGNLDILESIAYTDLSLKKFFEKIRSQPWFADTLFVISADHTYKNSLPEFDHVLGKFRIPIIFYHPQVSFKGVDENQLISQIDILPSILDFLGFKMKEKNYLGRSVFIPGERSVTLYDEGAFYTLSKDHVLRWVKGKEPQLFLISDVQFEKPLAGEPLIQQKVLNIQKATLQYFSEGMWDNRLYYPHQ